LSFVCNKTELFPRIKTTYPRNKQTGKQETAYQYIEFRGEEQAEAVTLTIENITNYIPKHCAVLLHMNDKVVKDMVNFECIKFNVPLTNRKIPFRIVNCYLF
jgi:hypothetical protein